MLDQGHYHKPYLDECHALKDSHEPGLKAHVVRKKSILGLRGTPPAQPDSEKERLVATYCPMLVDYTTDEAVLASLLNDYRLVVHRLPLSPVRDFLLTTKSGSQFLISERESYQHWSNRLANAAQDALPLKTLRLLRMQALCTTRARAATWRTWPVSSRKRCCPLPATSSRPSNRHCTPTHSKNKASQANLAKFNSGIIQRLACVAQLSEGINIPKLRTGIISHAFGNERKAAQRIGRLLRLNPEETATVHLLQYWDTVDEYWFGQTVAAFDSAKISYVEASRDFLGY